MFYYNHLFIYIDMHVFKKIEIGDQNSFKKSQNSKPLFPCSPAPLGVEVGKPGMRLSLGRSKGWKEGVLKYFFFS